MRTGNRGFSIVELLIVLALTSMLLGGLFTAFSSGGRITRTVDNEVTAYDELIIIDRQFSRDIAGAFIPVQAEQDEAENKGIQQEEKQKEESESKSPEQGAGATKSKKKVVKDPFIANAEGGQLQRLSLISNNPMRVYWSDSAGKPIPSVVRVVYTLQEDSSAERGKSRYILYRQEGTDLDLAAYVGEQSPHERYPLANSIKHCELTFVAEYKDEEQEQKGEQQPPKKNEKASYIRKSFHDWVIPDAKDVRAKVKVPAFVQMKLQLWDEMQENWSEHTLLFKVAAPYSKPVKAAEKQKPSMPGALKSGAQKTPAPAGKGAAQGTKPGAPKEPAKSGTSKMHAQLNQGKQAIMRDLKNIFGTG